METTAISGRLLRHTMIDHELSVSRFAEMVGVTQSHMSSILYGRRTPSRLLRLRIESVVKELDEAGPVPEKRPQPNIRRL